MGGWALLLGAGALAQDGAESGRATGVDFSWVRLAGAETCPGADVMRASVAALLGHDPFTAAPYLRIEGVASRPEAGWTAVLFFRDGDGESLGSRDITSGAETCESLAQAVVFATALAIDPRVGMEADAASVRLADAEGDAEAEAEGQAESDEGEVEDPVPSDAGTARSLPGPSVVAGVMLSAGSLPDGVAFGGALGVRGPMALEVLSWGVGAFFFGAQETDEIGVSLAGGWAEVCAGGAPVPWLELRACPRFFGGAYVVYVLPGELDAANPGSFSWLAVGVGLEALARIAGPVAVALDVTPLVSLTAREFTAGGREEPLFAEDRVGVMAHLGLAYAF